MKLPRRNPAQSKVYPWGIVGSDAFPAVTVTSNPVNEHQTPASPKAFVYLVLLHSGHLGSRD